MNSFHLGPSRAISRRMLLRGAGALIGLPLLEAMMPAFAASTPTPKPPRRMVAIVTNMGIMPQFFFPEKSGKDYETTPYLAKLAAHRTNLSVFSGLSHPGVAGGHQADRCFLTGAPHPERGGFRNTISLDQYAAEHIGTETRYPSLALAMSNEGGPTLSYTRSGAPISPDKSPRKLFEKLFVRGNADEVAASVEALRQGRSMLDFVSDQSKRLNRSLSAEDQRRMDQYFTSVRELEQRLHNAEAWQHSPKPSVKAAPPEELDDAKEFVRRTKLTLDVAKLALETDSTRLITLYIDTTVLHNITHHGNRPEVVAELRAKEEAQLDVLNGFLNQLTVTPEQNQTLLDRTMVLYGSHMGSANSHSNINLPVLLAGGGFRHGVHLAFDRTNNYPLANLHISMLQRLGIETHEFSTGKTRMRGLELA